MLEHSLPADDLHTVQRDGRIPWWVAATVVVGALLLISGALISKVDPTMLVANGAPLTDAARAYTDYLFARNLPLAVLLVFFLVIRARRMLAGFMVLSALIQILDVVDDLARAEWQLAPGLIVLAVVFLAGAWRLLGQAVWNANTWRDGAASADATAYR
jgi:hypothetical protein